MAMANDTQGTNFVVTIGRQFGSGGREIGKMVADALGVKYYDKELLIEAAKASGVRAELFEAADERSPSFFANLWSFNLGFNPGSFILGGAGLSDEKIYRTQGDVMIDLAGQHSCVIVGRSADYVLRNHPCVISVFIYASIEARVERILRRFDITSADKAQEYALKRDKLRASYYNFYTDKTWGDASSYDLCIDSSKLDSKTVCRIITDYVKARLECIKDTNA